MVVDKKDGTKRFCVDFRQLNKVTKSNSWPFTLTDDLLDQLGDASYFTSLDLKSGYWQVLMSEEDREKTAFVCHRGLFEFNVMPFGLCNAPQIFSELMSVVLQGLHSLHILTTSSYFQRPLRIIGSIFRPFSKDSENMDLN